MNKLSVETKRVPVRLPIDFIDWCRAADVKISDAVRLGLRLVEREVSGAQEKEIL